MNILVIEPDKILGCSYIRAFMVAGYRALRCASAQTALSALDDEAIDVIVLELQLAGHNGVEFLHELRSYPDWGHVPVVLHTTLPQADSGLKPQALQQLGIVQYLYKPTTTLSTLVQATVRAVQPA